MDDAVGVVRKRFGERRYGKRDKEGGRNGG